MEYAVLSSNCNQWTQITAYGLASAIITFVDFGTKVAMRVKELSESGHIPELFRDIKTRLPLIIDIIKRTLSATTNLLPEAQGAYAEIVRQSFKQVSQLDEVLKASFACWENLEGLNSSRTLDNMYNYALELAMFGHEDEGIAKWQEMIERCPARDASENTKIVFTYRSRAGIVEFQGDAAIAEVLYANLIAPCQKLYAPEHVHVFEYRLSHAEQIMRQGRLDEATRLSEAILASCETISEWRIRTSSFQTIAECYRLSASYDKAQRYRQKTLELHERNLGRDHKETFDAEEALADCYRNRDRSFEAMELYQRVIA
ncbi:MAG: hypothetical protein Q9173_005083 [Seirophora scorigena]